MMPTTDRLVPTRPLEQPCARCRHTAGQHYVRSVRTWEYCLASDCSCPGWCSTIECATCDYGTPRWAGYSQCLACLDYKVLPSTYAVKYCVGFDTETAIAEIRRWRGEWEVTHYGFELMLDRQHIFPESVSPSKYSDRGTTLGRKRYYARFVVVCKRIMKVKRPVSCEPCVDIVSGAAWSKDVPQAILTASVEKLFEDGSVVCAPTARL